MSVIGGLAFGIAVAVFAGTGILDLSFDLTLRSLLLLTFFSTIGLNAKFRALVKVGKAQVILVFACAIFLLLQNVVGVSVATALGKDPIMGLFGGSIALAGGLGTAIAWGEVALERDLRGDSEFGIACATFGLILGGLLGGPVAGRPIKKHGLKPVENNSSNSQR